MGQDKPFLGYAAYGLTLWSELVLPELAASDHPPDVTIYRGEVAAAASQSGVGGFNLLTLPTESGTFFLPDPNTIVLKPNPGEEEAKLRLFLLGPVMAIFLRCRGLLVLHASTVAVDDGAVAFVGNAGWGKSTTAGAFYQQGYPLLTDDILAIDTTPGHALALPSYPRAKIWPEAATALGYDVAHLQEVYPGSVKLNYPLKGGFVAGAKRLKCIYILSGLGRDNAVKACSPRQALWRLLGHSRANRIPNRPDLSQLTLEQCAFLVRTVPVRVLTRQHDLTRMAELVQFIEADLANLNI